MEKREREQYKKAMELFNKGKLKSSIKICDNLICENMKFEEALNLKGIMLYRRGILDDARCIFKINSEMNGNEIAKNYLEDLFLDEDKDMLYEDGINCLNRLEIDNAINILEGLLDSDFNCINVNCKLGECYIRKGSRENALKYLNKALELDNECIEARELLDGLESLYKKKVDYKKIVIMVGAILVTFSVAATLYKNYTNKKGNVKIEETEKTMANTEEKKESIPDFNVDKLIAEIENENFDNIHTIIKNVDKNRISEEKYEVYKKAAKLMENKGVQKFYDRGQSLLKDGNSKKALEKFEIALKYSKGNYLNEHIIYYISNILKGDNNKENYKKCLEMYAKEYPKGSYIEEVLYNLAILTNDKKYANILVTNFKNSIYNNDNIKGILNN